MSLATTLILVGAVLVALSAGATLILRSGEQASRFQKARSLAAWIRQRWAALLILAGATLTRKGMNLLNRGGSYLSSEESDPFDDFVTDYLDHHT